MTKGLTATLLSLTLLVSAFVGVSLAQDTDGGQTDAVECPEGFLPGVDDENYPICIEDDDVLDEDVVIDEETDVAEVVLERPAEPAEPSATVLGVTLPRTGGSVVLLVVVGGLLAALGAGVLIVGRRRRSAAQT